MPNTEETCQRISCNVINNDLDTGSDYDAIENHENDIPEKKVNILNFSIRIKRILRTFNTY